MIRRFEGLIAATPPEDLWSTLANYLREAVADGRQSSSSQIPVRALELGVALADRLDLPADLRQRLPANLAGTLFSSQEER